MIKPEELDATQRKAYDMWRRLGLTESAAMDALIEDGVVQLSEGDQFARTFRSIWGLSESAAEVAARGRHGDSATSYKTGEASRPVVESGLEWHARMQRELAELRRVQAATAELQKVRFAREITGSRPAPG